VETDDDPERNDDYRKEPETATTTADADTRRTWA
jgi:hypothetical protein